jgi:tripartite-type tricarboxylate transporter receptor subunit TctC
MHMARRPALSLLLGFGLVRRLEAAAEPAWPERTLRIVVPVAPGGSLDILGRLIARHLTETLGQSVVVENIAGAGSNLAFTAVARARADGHTLLIGSDVMAINATLYDRPGFDPLRDFAPIAVAVRAPQVLVVHPSRPAHDLAGFVAWARARQPDLTVASQGNGSIGHLTGAWFANRAEVQWTHVPYRGGGPAVQDVAAGHVDALFVTLPAAIEQIRAGRLRALAVTGAARSPALPDVPTIAEVLFPEFDVVTWQGLMAPAGTPRAVVERLAAESARFVNDPAIRRRLTDQGFEPVTGSPEGMAALLAQDVARWGELVRQTGARPE